MMKRTCITLLCLLMLLASGCGQVQPDAAGPSAPTYQASAAPAATPTKEDDSSMPPLNAWQQAYRDFLVDEGSTMYCYVQMSDLNLDGTPELLLSTMGTSSSWVVKILGYEQGALVQHDLTDIVFTILGLYYHKVSGELKWLDTNMIRDGYGVYISTVTELDFDSLDQVDTTILFYCQQKPNPEVEKEFTPDGSLYLNKEGAQIQIEEAQTEIQRLMQDYYFVTQADYPLLWDEGFNEAEAYLRTWQPLDKDEIMRIKRLADIPVVWQEERQFPDLLIENLNDRDISTILDKLDCFGEPQRVDVYGGFFEAQDYAADDLVVAWYARQKVVLARYNGQSLSFLPTPDQETLGQVYRLAFAALPEGDFPQALIQMIKVAEEQRVASALDDYAGRELAADEIEAYLDWYRQARLKEDPDCFSETGGYFGHCWGYQVDANNDGIDDIVLFTDQGTGHFNSMLFLVGQKNGTYELGESYNCGKIWLIVYQEKNYLVHYDFGAKQNYGLYLICIEYEQASVLRFPRYEVGYEVVECWYEDGYAWLGEHLLDRLHLSQFEQSSIYGSGETSNEAGISLVDIDNDGVFEALTKYATGSTATGDYIGLDCDDEAVKGLLDSLWRELDWPAQIVWIDETHQGNVLIIGEGLGFQVYKLQAYQVQAGVLRRLAGLELESIWFSQVEGGE